MGQNVKETETKVKSSQSMAGTKASDFIQGKAMV